MRRLGLGALTAVTLAACQGDKPGQAAAGAQASATARKTQRCGAAGVSTVIDSAGIGPVLRGERIAALAMR